MKSNWVYLVMNKQMIYYCIVLSKWVKNRVKRLWTWEAPKIFAKT